MLMVTSTTILVVLLAAGVVVMLTVLANNQGAGMGSWYTNSTSAEDKARILPHKSVHGHSESSSTDTESTDSRSEPVSAHPPR